MTKVLFAAAEAGPFYKTGGLGDVSMALPKAIQAADRNTEVRVVIPYYPRRFPVAYQSQLELVTTFQVQVGDKSVYCGVLTLTVVGVQYYLINNLAYFDRDNLYGYWDDGERFAFFQMAVCEMMERVEYIPDILHLNDWHTAFIPVLLAEKYYWIDAYQNIKTLLTIHNLEFQGIYKPVILASLFGIGADSFNESGTAFGNRVNWLKGGINFATAVNTVSPTYAGEIQTPAFGEHLDWVLRANQNKLSGIMNGIDTDLYDPAMDTALVANLKAKYENKRALQQQLGLPTRDVPFLAVVSRLTKQKGMDLLLDSLDPFLRDQDVQIVVLGTGDPNLEQAFRTYQIAYEQKVAVAIEFDTELAQRIYAGSDILLMPSAFEPCGLSQMMAMHYGTLPIVHAVGGLRDSVTPYNRYTGEGTRFSFDEYRPEILRQMMMLAVTTYWQLPQVWQQMQRQAMTRDFSWQPSGKRYQEMLS